MKSWAPPFWNVALPTLVGVSLIGLNGTYFRVEMENHSDVTFSLMSLPAITSLGGGPRHIAILRRGFQLLKCVVLESPLMYWSI